MIHTEDNPMGRNTWPDDTSDSPDIEINTIEKHKRYNFVHCIFLILQSIISLLRWRQRVGERHVETSRFQLFDVCQKQNEYGHWIWYLVRKNSIYFGRQWPDILMMNVITFEHTTWSFSVCKDRAQNLFMYDLVYDNV